MPDHNVTMEEAAADITPADKVEVGRTWGAVMQDPKGSSILLFTNFFNDFPEYKNLFPKFERISLEDLPKSRQLKAHGIAVINSLNGMIQNLDDPECLKELLLANGKFHANLGTTMEHYGVNKDAIVMNLWEVTIKTLKQACGSDFTPATEIAWRKVFRVMDIPIREGLISEGADVD